VVGKTTRYPDFDEAPLVGLNPGRYGRHQRLRRYDARDLRGGGQGGLPEERRRQLVGFRAGSRRGGAGRGGHSPRVRQALRSKTEQGSMVLMVKESDTTFVVLESMIYARARRRQPSSTSCGSRSPRSKSYQAARRRRRRSAGGRRPRRGRTRPFLQPEGDPRDPQPLIRGLRSQAHRHTQLAQARRYQEDLACPASMRAVATSFPSSSSIEAT
jgi:hypothetical protein